MLTPFGKAVRRARDEVNASLKEMADFLGVPSSYLSAIEHGQKKVPDRIVEGTFQFFCEVGPCRAEWARLAQLSLTHIKIDLTDADDLEREVLEAVGRKFKAMPHSIKKQIRDLLNDSNEPEVP